MADYIPTCVRLWFEPDVAVVNARNYRPVVAEIMADAIDAARESQEAWALFYSSCRAPEHRRIAATVHGIFGPKKPER